MTDLHQHFSWQQRLSFSWRQRHFLKKQLKKCLHPQLAKLFFASLFNSHLYLQQTSFKKRPLALLPICFVIGAAQSGKTSLINNSSLHLQAGEGLNSRYQPIAARGMPQFCHNHHKLFVELPAYLFINESNKHVPYLQQLLDFFADFGYLEKTYDIIYTINLEQLLHQDGIKQVDEFFASLTLFISKIPHPVNLQMAITKVDRILGFNEFFDDLSMEERQLACGIVLSNSQLLETFQNQFHHLVRRLTERLFWRCHSEHQLHRRLLVADFPHQFSQQAQLLAPFLARFHDLCETTPQVRIKSMYWLSGAQQGPLLDLLRGQPVEPTHTPTIHCLPLLLQRRAFFVRGLFHHINSRPIAAKKPPSRPPVYTMFTTWFSKPFYKLKSYKIRQLAASVKSTTTKSVKPERKPLSKKQWLWLACVPLLAIGGYFAYNAYLGAQTIKALQQDPQLAYTLITANDPTQALDAYLTHAAPRLSHLTHQGLLTDAQVHEKLQNAAIAYINQMWQEHILGFYQKNMQERFPLNPSAKKEIELKVFSEFYGPAGLTDRFYDRYLSDFIKQQKVTLTPEARHFFAHIKTLQKELFNARGQLALNFSLSPDQLSANIRRLDLSMAGTSLTVRAHTITNRPFSWPNTASIQQASYALQKRDALPISVTYQGAWSWLKVLQQFRLSDFSRDETGSYEGNLTWLDGSLQLTITSHQNLAQLLPLFSQLTVPKLIL